MVLEKQNNSVEMPLKKKIRTILAGYGRSIFSLILLFIYSVGITWLALWMAQDFSTMQYAGWLVFILIIISMAIMRYAYCTPWLHLIVIAVFMSWNVGTIEQYTPDRVMFRDKVRAIAEHNDKQQINISKIGNNAWISMHIDAENDCGESCAISCREQPYLCHADYSHIYLPWMNNKNYWTLVFIKKNGTAHFIRMSRNDLKIIPLIKFK